MAEKKFQHAAADVAGVECRIYQTEISSKGGRNFDFYAQSTRMVTSGQYDG